LLWSPFDFEEESRVWESFAALVERYSRMRVADARSRNGSCRSAFTRTITARRQPSSLVGLFNLRRLDLLAGVYESVAISRAVETEFLAIDRADRTAALRNQSCRHFLAGTGRVSGCTGSAVAGVLTARPEGRQTASPG
jgi:hypothetical protein